MFYANKIELSGEDVTKLDERLDSTFTPTNDKHHPQLNHSLFWVERENLEHWGGILFTRLKGWLPKDKSNLRNMMYRGSMNIGSDDILKVWYIVNTQEKFKVIIKFKGRLNAAVDSFIYVLFYYGSQQSFSQHEIAKTYFTKPGFVYNSDFPEEVSSMIQPWEPLSKLLDHKDSPWYNDAINSLKKQIVQKARLGENVINDADYSPVLSTLFDNNLKDLANVQQLTQILKETLLKLS